MRKSTAKKGTSSSGTQPTPSASTSGTVRNVARKSTSKQTSNLATPPPPKKHSSPHVSSPSSSPAKARKDAEKERLAHECAYYMMIANQRKYPIKKIDIVKYVLKDKSKHFIEVIKRANEILKDTFGIELSEVPDKNNSYILLNKHTLLSLPRYQDAELQQRGLLFVILAAIHLNAGPLSEENLWKMLLALKISENPKDNPVFGDVKKLISQELVKQLYLKRELVPNSDPAQYQYTWGYRADMEVDVSEIEKFYREVTGNRDSDLLAQLNSENNMDED